MQKHDKTWKNMAPPAPPPRANRPEAPRACRVVHRHNGSNSAALPSSTATAYSGQRTAGPDGLGWICDTDCKTWPDRKSTRLNSSHTVISYAVFCLKKKKKPIHNPLVNIHKIMSELCPHHL